MPDPYLAGGSVCPGHNSDAMSRRSVLSSRVAGRLNPCWFRFYRERPPRLFAQTQCPAQDGRPQRQRGDGADLLGGPQGHAAALRPR
jgi:hypothetical protein